MKMAPEFVQMVVATKQGGQFRRDRPEAIEAIRDACSDLPSARLFRGEELGTRSDVIFRDAMEHTKETAAQAANLPAVAASSGKSKVPVLSFRPKGEISGEHE